MSKALSISETVALLEESKARLRDFVEREKKLGQELATRLAAENRAFETGSGQHAARVTEETGKAEAALQQKKEAVLARLEKRRKRINEAHKLLRRRAIEDVSDIEGRRKHKLQQSALEAERKREKDLAEATGTYQDLNSVVAVSEQESARLEHAARRAFRGLHPFRRLLSAQQKWPAPSEEGSAAQLYERVQQLLKDTENALKKYRRLFLPAVVRYSLPLWLLAPIALACFFLPAPSDPTLALWLRRAGFIAAGLGVLRLAAFWAALAQGRALAHQIAKNLSQTRRLQQLSYERAALEQEQEKARIQAEFESTNQQIDLEYKQAMKQAIEMRDLRPRQLDEKAARVSATHRRQHEEAIERLESEREQELSTLKQQMQGAGQELFKEHSTRLEKIKSEIEEQRQALLNEAKAASNKVLEAAKNAQGFAAILAPAWDMQKWRDWTPPQDFKNAARFGELLVNLQDLAAAPPEAASLVALLPKDVRFPLLLTYPREGSILLETRAEGEAEALAALNNIIFRLLSSAPAGKLSFTIFDPVGLGQGFAGLMHLADYEESHINSRIWTQTTQMEEKLAELNEHMEKVIQMYLRNEYETIAEYNAQAGSIAEKYHFLVVASFPSNFSDTAARRLRNIAASGARCGVYTLIHWDKRHALPQDFVPDELRDQSVGLVYTERGFELAPWREPSTTLSLETPPSPEFATAFLHKVGESGRESNRVEVPFREIAPPNGEMWTVETSEELRVPIGRTGATKFQYLSIGKGTRQHALIAGKTGSGKSTLFHVMITNLALWCSPAQVEFYLVDFKKGVEFKCYATRRLPHGRVVAIESDRQFGLSVLERVDAELRRRGDLFRKLGVQDLAGYKRAGGAEQLPRSLLMIDEFQEFFVEEDRISQSAAVLLDRIVRQGRAFGIHVLLGSQTLGGAYTLARATLGQMVIRIALQCNEADAYLIMDQDNPAPRLLTRPGEGIYNDSAGSLEGNSPFQAVWLPEPTRDELLAKIRTKADESGKSYPGPFVFEGNAPAQIEENLVLADLLKTGPLRATSALPRIWLGSPNSIKGPTEAAFRRQSGNNLLFVGQNDDATVALFGLGLLALAAQLPETAVRFIFLDASPPGSPHRDFFEKIIHSLPHEVLQPSAAELGPIFEGLAEELKRRSSDGHSDTAPANFLFLHDVQNFKKLRQEDEFSFSSGGDGQPNPAAIFQNLLAEGPAQGIHTIASFDTFNNVGRFLGRKTLSEFETRVLFQMSANDSAALIDSPDASTLGLNRALLYNDREGYTETFRPYARPDNGWVEQAAKALKRLPGPATAVK